MCTVKYHESSRDARIARVYESTAPLLELPISPSTNFLAESSPRPQNDPWHSDSTVAAPPEPSLVLCSLLNTSCSFNLYVTWHNYHKYVHMYY